MTAQELVKDILITKAKAHNEAIDNYINVTLRDHFGSDTITVSQWFEAQQLIRKQNFYEKGKAIQDEAKQYGLRFLMDMQSDKLVIPNSFERV